MSEESTTPDLVELVRRSVEASKDRDFAAVGIWVDGKNVRTTNYTDIDEARAAAERLAEERG